MLIMQHFLKSTTFFQIFRKSCFRYIITEKGIIGEVIASGEIGCIAPIFLKIPGLTEIIKIRMDKVPIGVEMINVVFLHQLISTTWTLQPLDLQRSVVKVSRTRQPCL